MLRPKPNRREPPFACGRISYFGFFDLWRLRSRTPGPPPFLSRNSTRDFVKLQAIVKTSSFGFVSPK
jgi:hypothetical protein